EIRSSITKLTANHCSIYLLRSIVHASKKSCCRLTHRHRSNEDQTQQWSIARVLRAGQRTCLSLLTTIWGRSGIKLHYHRSLERLNIWSEGSQTRVTT